jgi:CubicO group peptidase (beta-lactamase class C family)
MRVMPREPQISRSKTIRRLSQVAISTSLALALAACGGGGGGGGQPTAPVQQNPPPTTPSNTAPSVEAGADQTITLPTATVQLNGTATDDPAQTLTYAWTATSGPSGVTFGSANAAATSVTFPSAGTYVLTLSVSDGSATGTDTVTVVVNPAPQEPLVYPESDTANSDPVNHGWTKVAAADVGMNQTLLDQAATYAQTEGSTKPNSAGMIVRKGRLVHSWGNIDKRFDLKSTTKSMGGIALALAIDDGRLALSDAASRHYAQIGAKPTTNNTDWRSAITIQQLATHTAGFIKTARWYVSPTDTVTPTLQDAPGTLWRYSDGGLNWLSEVLTAVFAEDLATVLERRVWTPLGLNSRAGVAHATTDVFYRDNANRDQTGYPIHNRELASGIVANPNAMARVGLLFLRKGLWANDQRVFREEFVTTVTTPVAANASLPIDTPTDFPGATTNYGVLWWTNATGQLPNVPRDAYWAWGLGDSLIVVIPSLDLVVVRAGEEFTPAEAQAAATPGQRVWNDTDWNGDYSVLAPFLDPIVQSVSK